MQPSRSLLIDIMNRQCPSYLRTTRLPSEHMKFTSRRVVGKDNVNGTGSKPKMICAADERLEVVMQR